METLRYEYKITLRVGPITVVRRGGVHSCKWVCPHSSTPFRSIWMTQLPREPVNVCSLRMPHQMSRDQVYTRGFAHHLGVLSPSLGGEGNVVPFPSQSLGRQFLRPPLFISLSDHCSEGQTAHVIQIQIPRSHSSQPANRVALIRGGSEAGFLATLAVPKSQLWKCNPSIREASISHPTSPRSPVDRTSLLLKLPGRKKLATRHQSRCLALAVDQGAAVRNVRRQHVSLHELR
ncbi:hypothetical protein VTK56DRAFT_9574 [Thermocarpiscus australiensis]